MCEVSENGNAPIVPPLGWVLSKPMREQFPNILKDCGNDAELAAEIALRVLAYNLTRAMNIVGKPGLIAAIRAT